MGTLDELRRALNERYEITRELGRGGMAIVYLAHDVRHDRPVTIKVMRPEISAQCNFQRFEFGWNLGRYRLGQLYERAGDKEQAREEYESFLSGWTGADQTLPAVLDARARLKRLLALRPSSETC